MAAEFQQKVLYLHQGLKHMVGLDGAARALHTALASRENEHRLVVLLPDAPRHNPSQGFMAVRQKEHQHLVPGKWSLRQPSRSVHPLLGHILSLVIQRFQLPGQPLRLPRVLAQQQRYRHLGGLKPPAGIQTGPQDKAHMVGGDGCRVQGICLDKLLQAQVLCVSEPP